MPRLLTDPPDLPPEVLWRSVLPLRPQRRIDYRIRGVEHIPLIVRAIPAMTEAVAWDSGSMQYPPDDLSSTAELRERVAVTAILYEALWTPRGRAFPSVEDLGSLSDDEIRELSDEVVQVLSDICPSQRRSDLRRWSDVLKEGAAHPSNLAEASVLACAVDVLQGGGQLPRPDRYWGAPFSQLLDGHWLAFQAARDVMKDRT
jgi:hypothetical protein